MRTDATGAESWAVGEEETKAASVGKAATLAIDLVADVGSEQVADPPVAVLEDVPTLAAVTLAAPEDVLLEDVPTPAAPADDHLEPALNRLRWDADRPASTSLTRTSAGGSEDATLPQTKDHDQADDPVSDQVDAPASDQADAQGTADVGSDQVATQEVAEVADPPVVPVAAADLAIKAAACDLVAATTDLVAAMDKTKNLNAYLMERPRQASK